MARGKIQIKRIENSTNRQVTYSKRRSGLFKKAHELTVLCDAKVSIIMLSGTNKLHEYISPSIATKQFFDQYQRTLGIDVWSLHYEKMQQNLKNLKEVNRKLRREIRQRVGESLDDLSFDELVGLDQEMENSLQVIRDRKNKVLTTQIETYKKKVKSVQDINKQLINEFNARREEQRYGLVGNGGDYDSFIGFQSGAPRMFALSLQPNQPNIHSGAGGSDLTTFTLLE